MLCARFLVRRSVDWVMSDMGWSVKIIYGAELHFILHFCLPLLGSLDARAARLSVGFMFSADTHRELVRLLLVFLSVCLSPKCSDTLDLATELLDRS